MIIAVFASPTPSPAAEDELMAKLFIPLLKDDNDDEVVGVDNMGNIWLWGVTITFLLSLVGLFVVEFMLFPLI
jgi:hypothetical protein